ncbi:MAG: lipopolysaccharide biosynthesis protein [Zoogloeaceae bacterium]|jgi:O-antigen/teichoic acid export membrane protein|nr:lipopolysaccharide biosynthesis protein [Zoogloeaceae bacterium]
MLGGLAKSSLKTLLVMGLRIFTQAGTLILVARLLSPGLYGHYVALVSLAVLLGILPTLGIAFVMLQRAHEGKQAIEDIWRYAWPLVLVLGVGLFLMYLLLVNFLFDDLVFGWWFVVGLGVIEIVFMPFVTLCGASFQAIDRVPYAQLLQWIPVGARLLVVFPCFGVDAYYTLDVFIVLQVAAVGISLAIILLITRNKFTLFAMPRWISLAEFHQSSSYCAMHFIAISPAEIDKIVLPQFISAHDVGIYAGTSRVLNALMTPVIAMLLASQPRLFRYVADHSRNNVSRLSIHLVAWAVFLGLFAMLILTVTSSILPYLFGERYGDMVAFAPILAFAALPIALRISGGTLLVALGHPVQRTIFEIAGIVTLLLCIAIFVPGHGLYGAAIALIMAESLMAVMGCILVFRAQKSLGAKDPGQQR